MSEEIVLDRGSATVMKLDADEQALMDEIEISTSRPQPVRRPPQQVHRPPPPPPQQQQEAMDAFVNPNKQAAPQPTQQDEENINQLIEEKPTETSEDNLENSSDEDKEKEIL